MLFTVLLVSPVVVGYPAVDLPAAGTEIASPKEANRDANPPAGGALVRPDSPPVQDKTQSVLPDPETLHAQEALNERGFAVAEDGVYGPETNGALRRFQERNGLGVTGVLDPATREKLFGTASTAEDRPGTL